MLENATRLSLGGSRKGPNFSRTFPSLSPNHFHSSLIGPLYHPTHHLIHIDKIKIIALSEALFDARIRVLWYYKIHVGYLAIIDDNKQTEKLFSAGIVTSLDKLGITPVLPLDMRAKLTLVLKTLD